MPELVAISDIHIDVPENFEWLERLCREDHQEEVLILGGDVAAGRARLETGLSMLAAAYSRVFFVPGNHDLWVQGEEEDDSWQQWQFLQRLCSDLGVETEPGQLSKGPGKRSVLIVPLLSWYAGPEDATASLFLPKPGEDSELSMWMDRVRIRWPEGMKNPAEFWLSQNDLSVGVKSSGTVVSFSHFLPRQELIFTTDEERSQFGFQGGDRAPRFNFSRVAGSSGIEEQIRTIGSSIHIHGHQHRNRNRMIAGVRYLSHCLGYPSERAAVGVSAEEIAPIRILEF